MIELMVSSALLGLVGSTHCAAMCGGLVAATQLQRDPKRRLPTLGVRASLVLTQNVGRVVSYAAAGAAAGSIGHAVGSEHASAGRLLLQALAAVVLVLVGSSLSGILPAALNPERLGGPLWARLQPRARALLPLATLPRAFGFGLLWGFLPCGLVYSGLAIAAVSGSARFGFLTMLAFGAGTLPMLLGLGALAQSVVRVFRNAWCRRAAGLLVMLFGLVQLVSTARAWGAPHSCCPPRVATLSSALELHTRGDAPVKSPRS